MHSLFCLVYSLLCFYQVITSSGLKFIRAQGICIVLYLDDGLVSVSGSLDTARSVSNTVRKAVESSGFVINEEKSRFEPSMKASWLGFDIDLQKGLVMVPPHKIVSLKNELENSIQCNYLPAKAYS
jgi:hypothetical protein